MSSKYTVLLPELTKLMLPVVAEGEGVKYPSYRCQPSMIVPVACNVESWVPSLITMLLLTYLVAVSPMEPAGCRSLTQALTTILLFDGKIKEEFRRESFPAMAVLYVQPPVVVRLL